MNIRVNFPTLLILSTIILYLMLTTSSGRSLFTQLDPILEVDPIHEAAAKVQVAELTRLGTTVRQSGNKISSVLTNSEAVGTLLTFVAGSAAGLVWRQDS